MRGDGRHTVFSFLRYLKVQNAEERRGPVVSEISSAPANAADTPPLFRSRGRLLGFILSYMACPVFSQMDQRADSKGAAVDG
jgi:hypothetical protein